MAYLSGILLEDTFSLDLLVISLKFIATILESREYDGMTL
jgi:hypothetical protein